MKVLIIGNGVAGIQTATSLRKLEADPSKLEILVCSSESYHYYSRIRLGEIFAEGLGPEDILVHPLDWYVSRSIEVRKGRTAVSVDPASRSVGFADGSVEGYDALVLATGSDPFRPPVPGVSLAGVSPLREMTDALWVSRWLEEGARRFAVAGGGLLGLEAAKHLKEAGAEEVTVIETADRLLPRQLDGQAAGILASAFASMGMGLRLGSGIASFKGNAVVESVALSGPGGTESLEVDGVILAAGVRPRVALAKAAGLSVNRGVVVDEGLRTSDPAIWAVGDCAEFRGSLPCIIPAALEQAPLAAASILGRQAPPYAGTVPSTVLKVAGIDLMSAGLVLDDEASAGAERIIRSADGSYEKFVIKEGKLAGLILLGSSGLQNWGRSHLGKPLSKEEIPASPE